MENKNIFIIGDSYSTYKGYIPEGYSCYYSNERTDAPIIKGVEKTWWKILAKENDLKFAVDIYPYYGSDVDAALTAGYDIRHGLIGAGVYASHGYERSHKDGVYNTRLVLKGYLGI